MVEALDRRIIATEADVRDFGAPKAAADAGVAEVGRLDIVPAEAGLVGFMRVLAEELAPEGIRVNTIRPSTVATAMILNDAVPPGRGEPDQGELRLAARTLNTLPVVAADPVDISNAVLCLVSDDGRYVTGAQHVVDAGGSL